MLGEQVIEISEDRFCCEDCKGYRDLSPVGRQSREVDGGPAEEAEDGVVGGVPWWGGGLHGHHRPGSEGKLS